MLDCISNLVKTTLVTCIVYSISLFYGWVTVISVLVKWFMKGNEFWVVKERTLPPLCLQDPVYGRHSYIKLKDIRLHYVENGDRSKPLMLFVHGFPEFWFTWRKQLEYFSRSHWVVALDLRGYGDSDKPSKISDYKMEILAKDIYEFVKALKRDKCILIGHDWGGAISWCVAATCPDLVEKLVILNCPHPGAMAKKISGSFKQFLKSWYIFFFQLPFIPEICYRTNDLLVFNKLFGDSISEEEMEGYKYTWAKKDAWTPPINYYRNILNATALLNPRELPKVRMPSLIVWGENDLALEKDLAELCRPHVDNLQIVYISGASHFVQHDRADEVNSVIKDFVS